MHARAVFHVAAVASIACGVLAGPRTVDDGQPKGRASKTWTNADLERLRAPVNVIGSTNAAAPPQPQAVQATPPVVEDASSEATWRAQAQALDARIAQLEARIALLSLLDEQWTSLALGMDAHDRVAAQELVRIRRDRAESERQLEQSRGEKVLLEESARKASIPPGWLR